MPLESGFDPPDEKCLKMTLLRQFPSVLMTDFWLGESASTFAGEVDSLFYLIYWISVAFFVPMMGAMLYFMVVYRRRPKIEAIKTATHNYPLELTWSVVPTLLIVVIFVKGFGTFLDMRNPPGETYDISVTASRWNWSFLYPNGVRSSELHSAKGIPTKLVMTSTDVLHSLYLRDFRVKQDVVPGRNAVVWYEATKAGEYDLQCTEYCGKNHSDMLTKCFIHETEAEFDAWLKKEREKIFLMPPLELGKLLYEQRGCVACHSLDGSRRVGPSFKETWGNSHEFGDGSSAMGDREYVINSIINPQGQIRAGYQGVMPSFKGQLEDAELNALVGFVMAANPEFKAKAEKDFAKPPQRAPEEGAAAGPANGSNGTTEPPTGEKPPAETPPAGGNK